MALEMKSCPQCAGTEWNAIEQFTSQTPCTITREADGWQVEFDSRAEMNRNAATSVITAYICSTADCGHVLAPTELQ
jgi:hypothetical protein